ncbi:MAG: helix-turn-helix domain-containing protein [Gammaproteobacteria bacterium]|nr:helix-turn-helix domain-containing protein [Gammaproteobacteria bacterium]
MTTNTDRSLKFLERISGKKLTIGSLLWSIRECDEIKQVKFARILGISRQYLCDLEHNRRGLSPEMAAKFARKLGYSEEQFIRLALQDALDRAGLNFEIEIRKAA